MKKTPRMLIILSGVVIGVILIAGAVVLSYYDSLYRLIDHGEITGDPSIPESNLFDPEDLVTTTSLSSDTSSSSSETNTTPSETTNPTTEMTLSTLPVLSDKNVYNILLIGTDNRGDEINGRSDAMIIFSINKKTRTIHLVSLMRGLYVKIEDHGWSMLNNAFSWGGSSKLILTIEENLRVHISDYVVINFSSFVQAIDAVGGVDIELTAAEVEQLAAFFPDAGLAEGYNHLDGQIALAYARIRHIDSDYRRTARQRTIINNLITKMTSLGPVELDTLARQLLPLVKSDISSSKMIDLLVNSPSYANYEVKELMLPIKGSFETIIVHGAQMVSFDVNANIEALQEFLYKD
jgi:polyisoprenyl-teichoic acid--peptidoglycan teichoic acid transferase